MDAAPPASIAATEVLHCVDVRLLIQSFTVYEECSNPNFVCVHLAGAFDEEEEEEEETDASEEEEEDEDEEMPESSATPSMHSYLHGGWKLSHVCKLDFESRAALVGDMGEWKRSRHRNLPSEAHKLYRPLQTQRSRSHFQRTSEIHLRCAANGAATPGMDQSTPQQDRKG